MVQVLDTDDSGTLQFRELETGLKKLVREREGGWMGGTGKSREGGPLPTSASLAAAPAFPHGPPTADHYCYSTLLSSPTRAGYRHIPNTDGLNTAPFPRPQVSVDFDSSKPEH